MLTVVTSLNYKCNRAIQCPYCWLRPLQEQMDEATERPVEDWLRGVDKLHVDGYEVCLNIGGGEPFCFNGLEQLISKCDKVCLTTNMLADMEFLLKPEIKSRIANITCSFHYVMDNWWAWAQKYKRLQDAGLNMNISLMDWYGLPAAIRYLARVGLENWRVQPYLSKENIIDGKLIGPIKKMHEGVNRWAGWFDEDYTKIISKPILCNAGYSQVFMMPNGSVYRCASNRKFMFNLFDDDKLRLNIEAKECDFEYPCSLCDEDLRRENWRVYASINA